MADLKDLLVRLDDILIQETFTAAAVKGIQKMREDLEDNIKRVERLERSEAELKQDLRRSEAQLSAWKGKESVLLEREGSCDKRETKLHEKDIQVATAQAQSRTYQECVGLIFRNPVVRSRMNKDIPMPDNNGYVTSHSAHEETETTEE